MLMDRGLLVADLHEASFPAFTPEFECEGTAARRKALLSLPGHREASPRAAGIDHHSHDHGRIIMMTSR